MQDFIRFLEQHNELKIIDTPLDIELEIPHLAYLEVKKKDSKALLFTHPIHRKTPTTPQQPSNNAMSHDHTQITTIQSNNEGSENKEDKQEEIESFRIPVLMNVFGSQRRLELIATQYNCDSGFPSLESIAHSIKSLLNPSMPKTLSAKLTKLKELWAMRHVFPRQYKGSAPCQERVYKADSINLFSLPILKTWEEDGGRFITMGQVYTKSLSGEAQNVGMYRLQIHSHNTLLMHWQIHKDANHFFHEYQKAGKLMPVSIAIGGDPLYIWCGQAPMPPKVFELMLYGLIRGKNPKLTQCVSNELCVPYDCDIVIEGFVDTTQFAPEGKFGDHTGFYTPIEPYPIMQVQAITMKREPIYLATVVGKPPLEDKYMGYMTERLFLPLLQTSAHGLIDYAMPENGVFHNLILAKVETNYPAQSLQMMHTFFGVGQMSFVKHAIFVDRDAPSLHTDYKALSDYILSRIDITKLYTTMGNCDALDHACESFAVSGKLGIDASGTPLTHNFTPIGESDLLSAMQAIAPEVCSLHIYAHKNPIILCGVQKAGTPMLSYAKQIGESLGSYGAFFIFVDSDNDLRNYYMLIWRIVNSIDVARDFCVAHTCAFLDATAKSAIDGYEREWPKDTLCTQSVLNTLKEHNLLDGIDESFYQQFGIV